MTIASGSPLEIFRGADPRVLEDVEDNHQSSESFQSALTHINAPVAIGILRRAKDYLRPDMAGDEAYLRGVQEGIALVSRIGEIAHLEASFAASADLITNDDAA